MLGLQLSETSVRSLSKVEATNPFSLRTLLNPSNLVLAFPDEAKESAFKAHRFMQPSSNLQHAMILWSLGWLCFAPNITTALLQIVLGLATEVLYRYNRASSSRAQVHLVCSMCLIYLGLGLAWPDIFSDELAMLQKGTLSDLGGEPSPIMSQILLASAAGSQLRAMAFLFLLTGLQVLLHSPLHYYQAAMVQVVGFCTFTFTSRNLLHQLDLSAAPEAAKSLAEFHTAAVCILGLSQLALTRASYSTEVNIRREFEMEMHGKDLEKQLGLTGLDLSSQEPDNAEAALEPLSKPEQSLQSDDSDDDDGAIDVLFEFIVIGAVFGLLVAIVHFVI
jgi:hypothetical protein